jgi:hypothetical protein
VLQILRRLFDRAPESDAGREDDDERESERLKAEADAARYSGAVSEQGRGGGLGHGF